MSKWLHAAQGALGVLVLVGGISLVSAPAALIVLGFVVATSALAGAYVRGSDG